MMEKILRAIAYLIAKQTGGDAGELMAEAMNWAEMTTPANTEKETDDAIERIYKMYPTKDIERNISTGKCSKDKSRIKTLLKTHTEERLAYTITRYLRESAANHSYIKNFSTFLNNLPEYGDEEEEEQPHTIMPERAAGRIVQPSEMDEYIRNRQAFYDNI